MKNIFISIFVTMVFSVASYANVTCEALYISNGQIKDRVQIGKIIKDGDFLLSSINGYTLYVESYRQGTSLLAVIRKGNDEQNSASLQMPTEYGSSLEIINSTGTYVINCNKE